MIIKDIAQYEDTDSELAKYTIQTQQEEIERLNKSLGDITILFAKEREKTRQAIEYIQIMKWLNFNKEDKKKLLKILGGNNND